MAVDTTLETYYRLDDGVRINQKISEAVQLLGISSLFLLISLISLWSHFGLFSL